MEQNNKTIAFQSWWELTSIQVGGVICLPILMIGVELGRICGFPLAVRAICIGNTILFLLGMVIARMSYQYKKNTVENAARYFANSGSHIFTFVLVSGCIGWFAIQLDVIGLSILEQVNGLLGYSVSTSYGYCINIVLGTIMTSLCMHGIRSIEKLSSVSMPALVLTLFYMVYLAHKMPSYDVEITFNPLLLLQGVTLVLVAVLLAVVDMPTYYRFARSGVDAYISTALLYLVCTPLLEITGAYIAARGQVDSVISLTSSSSGLFGSLWILVFLILAGWTTNNANLFSAASSLKIWLPSLAYAQRVVIAGVIGTILSCFNVMQNFGTLLECMSIAVGSFGAIIAVQYCACVLDKDFTIFPLLNTIIWFVATSYGIGSFFGLLSITSFAVLDTFIFAFIASIISIIYIRVSTRKEKYA